MILAHDLGTTGDKATLVDDDCTLVGSVSVSYGTHFGPGGVVEQDPEDWWRAFCEATGALLAKAGVTADAVDAVVFSGQMMGAVIVDGHNDPVRPAIIWADSRSGAQVAQLERSVGMERVYAITGHRLNATYSLSKLMWMRDMEPQTFARADGFLLAKDFLVARLTGQRMTDPSDASSTDAYDLRSGAWSAELLAAAGLPSSLFPEVRPSTTVAGGVLAERAAETGLLAGTPVVIGGGDGPMAALGAGITNAASGAYAYLGSSSWVSSSSDAPLDDPLMRTMTFAHVVPGQFVPTATMQAGGASVKWLADLLDEGRHDLFEYDTVAAADGLFFLPHLLGERSPYWNPRARAAFIGLLMHHGRPELARAVIEGVAFTLLTGVRAFRELGVPFDRLSVIGGAAKSSVLLRVMADAWGASITPRSLVDEATSIGAAVVGGVAVGIFDGFDVAASASSLGETIEPDARTGATYAEAYPRFLDAYARLEPWFDELPR